MVTHFNCIHSFFVEHLLSCGLSNSKQPVILIACDKKKNIVTIDDMQYVYLTIIDNMTNLKYMVKHKIKDVTQLMTLLEISS